MCAKILEAAGKLNMDEYNFFLRGGVVRKRFLLSKCNQLSSFRRLDFLRFKFPYGAFRLPDSNSDKMSNSDNITVIHMESLSESEAK